MKCDTPKNELLKHIRCHNFAAHDLLLYLDTHPKDKKAFELFVECVEKTKELIKEYESAYGPLSGFGTASQESFNWLDSPWPWEKEANR